MNLEDPHFSGEGRPFPMSVALSAHYDGLRATASVKAVGAKHQILDAEATVDAAIAAFLDGSSKSNWTASAHAHFAGFPLSAIGGLEDKVVSGQLNGDVAVTDLHKDAHAIGHIAVDGLRVGGADYKSAWLEAKVDGRALNCIMRVDQDSSFAEARATAVTTWGTALIPVLDSVRPLELALQSKNFQVAGLLPLLAGSLDELSGRLDANMRIALNPQTEGARLSGTMALRQGVIEVAAGGGEFHDISALLRFNPHGLITLERLGASGRTGRLQAAASARLEGTRLQAVNAVIVIPNRSAIPLFVHGTEIGDLAGRIEVSGTTSKDGHRINLNVRVPSARIALPPEGISSDVQALTPMADVLVGAHEDSRRGFVLVPLDPVRRGEPAQAALRVAATVRVSHIEVTQGTGLKIDLDGVLYVQFGSTSDVKGQIKLKKGGSLEVQGRTFQVENGTITFVGHDPSNPQVVAKANWTAPDGTVVSATFVGPLQTGKVTLTSEPSLPRQDIVELLLYGTADGQQAQASSQAQGTENTAVAAAGDQATQPLNHALRQLGLGAVTARVNTSQSSNPRPEVEVEIARGISVQLAVVLGVPPPGVNPDTTLITMDWRFLSNWSLAATLGDAGTAIFDLLWKRRY